MRELNIPLKSARIRAQRWAVQRVDVCRGHRRVTYGDGSTSTICGAMPTVQFHWSQQPNHLVTAARR